MITPGIYKLKEEFFKTLGISRYTYDKRKDDLLEWLKDFFDYELKEGRPSYIIIHEQYSEYQPLPRDGQLAKQERMLDYEKFAQEHLPKDWACESKARMARNAIFEFAGQKYGHRSARSVANVYMGPAMEKYGEHTTQRFWAWHDSYEQVTDEKVLKDWKDILRKHKLSAEEISSAFFEDAENGDGKKFNALKEYYKIAIDEFIEEYGDFLVYVSKWKLRSADYAIF